MAQGTENVECLEISEPYALPPTKRKSIGNFGSLFCLEISEPYALPPTKFLSNGKILMIKSLVSKSASLTLFLQHRKESYECTSYRNVGVSKSASLTLFLQPNLQGQGQDQSQKSRNQRALRSSSNLAAGGGGMDRGGQLQSLEISEPYALPPTNFEITGDVGGLQNQSRNQRALRSSSNNANVQGQSQGIDSSIVSKSASLTLFLQRFQILEGVQAFSLLPSRNQRALRSSSNPLLFRASGRRFEEFPA